MDGYTATDGFRRTRGVLLVCLAAYVTLSSARDLSQQSYSTGAVAQQAPVGLQRQHRTLTDTVQADSAQPVSSANATATSIVNITAAENAVNNGTYKPAQMPMPATVPFVRNLPSGPTFPTFLTELGASINGTAFVPGACGSRPTALGYQCSWASPEGVVLHWSYNVTHPPKNRCTGNNAAPNPEAVQLGPGDVAVHFAMQAATPMKLHLAFVDPAGRLFPSEGVHGWGHCMGGNCNSSSSPEVQVLYFTSPSSYETTGRRHSQQDISKDLMDGWASWVSADFDGLTGVLCFSRKAHSKLMQVGDDIHMEGLVSYAINNRTEYTVHAPRRGMALINFKTGMAEKVDLPVGMLVVHGALMLVAFAVLLPLGLLVSRHKWLFIEQGACAGELSPWWALTHLILLILGASAGLAGMIVVLVGVGNTGTGMLTSSHQVLGLISIGLSLVLVAMYGLRPFLSPSAPGHGNPLLTSQKTVGLLTVLAGWTAIFLGCVVIYNNWAIDLHTWFAPCAAIVGAVTMAAIALELRFQKLVRSGMYNPKTCSMNNIAPLPLAHIRTTREPINPKKQEWPSSNADTVAEAEPGSSGIMGGLFSRGTLAHMFREDRAHSSPGSSPGTADSLKCRRGRQSTSGAGSNAGIATGFPTTPVARGLSIANEHV